MKLNLFDSHVHTSHSFDADSSLDELCRAALEKGVMGFAVTDHFDCGMEEAADAGGVRASLREISALESRYRGRLRLARGVELGQGHLEPQLARELCEDAGLDCILGSVHCAAPGKDLYDVNFNDPAVRVSDVLRGYFRMVYEMTLWGKFHVLAHLCYPERYIWGKYRIPVDLSPYGDEIQTILRRLVEEGKGLEVNTSGYRQGLGKTFPGPGILKRYYQLGGRVVTLGSDAHRAEDLAADFGVAMDLLTSIGFQYFAFYRQGEPVMLKLI